MLDVSLLNAQIYPFMCNFVPKDAQRLHGGYHNYFTHLCMFNICYHFGDTVFGQSSQTKNGNIVSDDRVSSCNFASVPPNVIWSSKFIRHLYINAINSCNTYSDIVGLHVTGFCFVLFCFTTGVIKYWEVKFLVPIFSFPYENTSL